MTSRRTRRGPEPDVEPLPLWADVVYLALASFAITLVVLVLWAMSP